MTQHNHNSQATPLDDWRHREGAQRRKRRKARRRCTTVVAGERVMRLPEVSETVGLKKSAIYDGIKRDTFPPPVPLGDKAVGWLASEIYDWLAERIAVRDRDAA